MLLNTQNRTNMQNGPYNGFSSVDHLFKGGRGERESKMARSFLESESVRKGADFSLGDSPSLTITWCVFQSPNCSGIFSGIFFSPI